jgi:tryptophanyl-tRNA synthetase
MQHKVRRFKKQLAQDMNVFLEPFRDKITAMKANETF